MGVDRSERSNLGPGPDPGNSHTYTVSTPVSPSGSRSTRLGSPGVDPLAHVGRTDEDVDDRRVDRRPAGPESSREGWTEGDAGVREETEEEEDTGSAPVTTPTPSLLHRVLSLRGSHPAPFGRPTGPEAQGRDGHKWDTKGKQKEDPEDGVQLWTEYMDDLVYLYVPKPPCPYYGCPPSPYPGHTSGSSREPNPGTEVGTPWKRTQT